MEETEHVDRAAAAFPAACARADAADAAADDTDAGAGVDSSAGGLRVGGHHDFRVGVGWMCSAQASKRVGEHDQVRAGWAQRRSEDSVRVRIREGNKEGARVGR